MRKHKKRIRILLGTVAAALFLFSAAKVLHYLREMHASADYNEALIRQAVVETSSPSAKTTPKQKDDLSADARDGDAQRRFSEVSPISVDFSALREENADIVGWLYCPETLINYPVAQAEDNDYYLERLLDGTWNAAGTLFADCRNSVGGTDWNTVIYGHNMVNGTMFGKLRSYRAQEYYEQHPVIYFLTPEADYKIELLYGFVTPADAALYDVYLLEEEREAVIADMLRSSDFTPQTEFAEGERLLTLSTCSYEFGNARYVVVGKMIEIGKK